MNCPCTCHRCSIAAYDAARREVDRALVAYDAARPPVWFPADRHYRKAVEAYKRATDAYQRAAREYNRLANND